MGSGAESTERSLSDAESRSSHLPPPPVPDPERIPPPQPEEAPAGPVGWHRKTRIAVLALSLAVVGWLIWIYGWIAETDTGYPDGLACTGNPATSDAYASCMRSSELGGVIASALTVGLAVAGLVALARSRRDRFFDPEARWLSLAAATLCGTLAVAGLSVWVRGAQGELYEDRLGSTTWNIAHAAAVVVASAAAWLLTPGDRSSA